jgi:hypothetical protein
MKSRTDVHSTMNNVPSGSSVDPNQQVSISGWMEQKKGLRTFDKAGEGTRYVGIVALQPFRNAHQSVFKSAGA